MRLRGLSGRDRATEDLGPDVLRELPDLHHHIVHAFVLGVSSQRRFVLRDADEAGIETDIIAHLGNASQDGIVCSRFSSDLSSHRFIEAHRSFLIEDPIDSRAVDDHDPIFNRDSRGQDVIDPSRR